MEPYHEGLRELHRNLHIVSGQRRRDNMEAYRQEVGKRKKRKNKQNKNNKGNKQTKTIEAYSIKSKI